MADKKYTINNVFDDQINNAKSGWEFTTTVVNDKNSTLITKEVKVEKENK